MMVSWHGVFHVTGNTSVALNGRKNVISGISDIFEHIESTIDDTNTTWIFISFHYVQPVSQLTSMGYSETLSFTLKMRANKMIW